MQRAAGSGRSWYLDCRSAAKLLGIIYQTANKYLFRLEHDGVLRCAARGTSGTGPNRKSNEYIYTVTEEL
jgi:hypothetical protein